MSTSQIFYLHGINVLGSTFISQLRDTTPSNNFQDLVEFSAGQTGPQYSGSGGAAPDISFSTSQVANLLAALDVEAVAMDLSGGNTDLYYKLGAAFGLRTADASLAHERYRLTSNALLVMQSLRASQGGTTEASARIIPTWDGTNNPIIYTGSVALAGTSAVDSLYTLGHVDLNGTDLNGVTDVDLQFNPATEELASDGEEFPSYVGVAAYSPTLTIRSRDTALYRTYGPKGTALTAMDLYFRKRTASGINLADVTAEHIKITATAGTIKSRQVSGLNATVEIFVQLIKANATTAPITISTVSAIT